MIISYKICFQSAAFGKSCCSRAFYFERFRWKSFWFNLTLLTVARAPGFQIRNPAVAARGHNDAPEPRAGNGGSRDARESSLIFRSVKRYIPGRVKREEDVEKITSETKHLE